MPDQTAEFPGRPSWASDRLVDESLVEYSYPVGTVGPFGDDPVLEVIVIQQDHLDLEADPPTITRHRPQLRVGQMRMSPDQAHELAEVLSSGVQFMKSVTPGE